ncbi:ribose-phosphate pyrophosphokinase [Hortaea werneckii]|nr:ribose-phosphate pyrophosphokinase [Hortaea werneckii]KAI7670502.1 ribose-phosphate pyrophosphokinase [Hortaea werneckii]
MVRNIVMFSGSSHPALTETICTQLGIPPSNIHLAKFSVGETRVEVGESVRGKDVFIVQSGGGNVNDHLMELLITISACKTASAKRVTAVLPLFPYSRQSDLPYNKVGAPLARQPTSMADGVSKYTFESRPGTPAPGGQESAGLTRNGSQHLHKRLNGLSVGSNGNSGSRPYQPKRKDTLDSIQSDVSAPSTTGSYFEDNPAAATSTTSFPTSAAAHPSSTTNQPPIDFKPQRGYKQWVAQAGTLVADLLTCAGADHIITMDLHDPQYQGFFDIPVDNLYGRHLLKKYIQHQIMPKYGGPDGCVIVSPDAGGAKRATNIADALGMDFALIHKERRPTAVHDRQNATMLLVGSVASRTAILIDDLADTSNTITRAAKLLKKEGAHTVLALVTHGVFSGDAVERINASCLDKVIATNSVPQEEHVRECPKLEVLEVGTVFAEAIRRVHHGESISVLFQYD